MPENWKKYRLGDLIEVNENSIRKGDLDWINYIDIKSVGTGYFEEPKRMNFEDAPSRARRLLKEGDTVISSVRPNLKSYFYSQNLKENTIASTGFAVLTPKKINNRFLYYLTTNDSYINYLVNSCTGSAYPAFGPQVLLDSEVLIPESLQEQKSIASILSALDDKIELNLQMNKTLEEMAMALYKHWFVDYGPFQHGEFVDSELGEIPKGWEVKTLGDLFKIKHGFAFKGKYFQLEEREELLLTPGNFQSSGGIKFNWGKQKFYSGDFPDDYILTKGDLVIALTDLTQSCEILGAPAIIPDNDYKYLHNQRLGLVTDLSPQFSNEFIYCICNSRDFRSFIRNSKTGSTVSHTSPTRIYDYKIALPPQGLENNFREELKNLLELTFTNSSENKSLTQLRDTLLPKLISAEVRVKDAEKTLSEVL